MTYREAIEIYGADFETDSDLARYLIKNNDEFKHKKFNTVRRKLSEARVRVKKQARKSIDTNAELKEGIKKYLKKDNFHSIVEISDEFDVGVSKVKSAISDLVNEGFNLKIESDKVSKTSLIEPSKHTRLINVDHMTEGVYKFGATGDNHYGSRYAREEITEALYDEFERQGVKIVYNTGNWIDGEARFNKHDLKVHGLDNQINYFLKNYPKRKGIKTYFVTGDDHEGWYTQREGVNVGKYMIYKSQDADSEFKRDDLVFLGHMEADVVLESKNGGKTTLRVLHPGGGSSYATSYSVQKIVESYQGGEKPDILLAGHYHKAEYTYVRGVHVVQTGTTCDQTPFMRKKKLAAHIGGWVIEFGVDKNGAVTWFKQQFIPFYDKKYYVKNWEYKWA